MLADNKSARNVTAATQISLMSAASKKHIQVSTYIAWVGLLPISWGWSDCQLQAGLGC